MRSTELGRRPLASTGRRRQIFARKKTQRGQSVLVAGTIVVCLALVFTIGFKVGRTYQTETVAAVDQLAVTATATGAVAGRRE